MDISAQDRQELRKQRRQSFIVRVEWERTGVYAPLLVLSVTTDDGSTWQTLRLTPTEAEKVAREIIAEIKTF